MFLIIRKIYLCITVILFNNRKRFTYMYAFHDLIVNLITDLQTLKSCGYLSGAHNDGHSFPMLRVLLWCQALRFPCKLGPLFEGVFCAITHPIDRRLADSKLDAI